MVKYVETGTGYSHSVGYEYNAENNLTSLVETINGTDYTTSYVYDDDNRVSSMLSGGNRVDYTYDEYGRISTKITRQGTESTDPAFLTETYTYVGNSADSTTSTQIATYKVETASYSVTYTYTYDDNGNILSINDGTYTTSYVYDSANQLIQENNARKNQTDTWTYDNAGNIQSHKTYAYTTDLITDSDVPTATDTYAYNDDKGWGDLLTAYNGATIEYDEIGNPTSDGTWTYTWEHGRQLASMSDGTGTWNYTYNSDGMRTLRAYGMLTYEYVYNGSQLTQMVMANRATRVLKTLSFAYDANGIPMTVTYDDTVYYYATNVQGDVVAILNSSGTAVVTYTYDAWGNILSTDGSMASTLGTTNPLRYRGYVYDQETELYYLQSRYYDPELGRFINADEQLNDDSLGKNLFIYCSNNPVTRADTNGRGWWIAAGAIIGAVAGGVAKVITNTMHGKKWNEGLVGAIVGGAVYGTVITATGNVWAAGFASAAAEAVTNAVISYTPVAEVNGTSQKEVNVENIVESVAEVTVDTAINGTVSVITGKIAGKIIPTNSGWFKPKKFSSCFIGKYAIKSELQTLVQTGLTIGIEAVKAGLDFLAEKACQRRTTSIIS